MKIIELEEVTSTNEYLKQNDLGEDIIVSAKRQSAGKGTKGRSFVSADGGLYISVMRHYTNLPASDAFKIMVNACVAVCKTLEKFKLSPVVRWSNDVLVGGKKISGTLIENTFSGDKIIRSIVGIGINVYNDLPEELKAVATTVSESCGKKISVQAVRDELIKNLQKEFTVTDYKKFITWFGKTVTLHTADSEYQATAKDVLPDGRLVVDRNGEILKISSAEVTLRI
ncbi:MAG: biotin--[acetyl-CoA-carboxylase] ligase [Clostridia bacterium]|nr:biotin--[acetyl-CoA-carboxylase] ligase [Clostridia bacterium]